MTEQCAQNQMIVNPTAVATPSHPTTYHDVFMDVEQENQQK